MKKITFCAALLSSVCCLPLVSAMDGASEDCEVNEDDFRPVTLELRETEKGEENSETDEVTPELFNKISVLAAESRGIAANYKRHPPRIPEIARFLKDNGENLERTIRDLATAVNSIGTPRKYDRLKNLVLNTRALIFDARGIDSVQNLTEEERSQLAQIRRGFRNTDVSLPPDLALTYLCSTLHSVEEEIQEIQKTLTGKAK